MCCMIIFRHLLLLLVATGAWAGPYRQARQAKNVCDLTGNDLDSRAAGLLANTLGNQILLSTFCIRFK